MHEQCIKDEALRATYNRLGTDKPHLPPEIPKKEKDEDEAKRPLSPTETGAAVSAQHSIDVKADADSVMNDNVEVKQGEDEDAQAAPEDSPPATSTDARATSEKTEVQTPAKASSGKPSSTRKAGRPKKKSEANGDNSKPWEGLFEVTLKTDGVSILEFKDLRQGVEGGQKTWTESVKCLVCGNQVV